MSGFGPSAQPVHDFTIVSSATDSNVIDGGGRSLSGLIFPAAGWTGTGFTIKEGLNTTTLMPVYDSSAAAVTVTTPASGSAAILVKLEPSDYHTMQNVQIVADSSAAASTIIKPVWTRYNPKG